MIIHCGTMLNEQTMNALKDAKHYIRKALEHASREESVDTLNQLNDILNDIERLQGVRTL